MKSKKDPFVQELYFSFFCPICNHELLVYEFSYEIGKIKLVLKCSKCLKLFELTLKTVKNE